MKSIVVLNECMFSNAQFEYIKKNFSDAAFYNDTSSEKSAINRIGSRNIVIMDQFVCPFTEKILKACAGIELIIVNTTAYDLLDINLLNKHGVKLVNMRSYATRDVAEVALSMVTALNNRLEIAQKIVKGEKLDFPGYKSSEKVNDIWPGHPIVPFIERKQLKNQTIGIVGLGNIGQSCAEIFNGIGMNVLGFNRSRKSLKGIDMVSLRKLFEKSDIILITIAYKKNENDKIIDSGLLKLAKNGAIFVSMAHPNLIDLSYLCKNPNKFAGIGMDYLVTDAVRKLMTVRKENIIITPHLGSQSVDAVKNMTEAMIGAAAGFSEGKPIYTVN